jgi:membrane dipeptidase
VAHQAAYFRSAWLPQLQAGGVNVQVLPVFIDDDFRPESALRQTLLMIETAWRIATGCADVVKLCLGGADIRKALAEGRIALVLALEGCEAVGVDVGLFETLHRVGIRMASFTHYGRTMLADGSAEDDAGGRLTRAGVEAVQVCEDLGILLDVSHLGAASTDHLLEIARRPVLASHSSAFAQHQHHRNLTDERIRGIADLGGVIGINFFGEFIRNGVPSIPHVVDHIDHVASIVGSRFVGLGPDFIKEIFEGLVRPEEREWNPDTEFLYVAGLEGPAGLPLITNELLTRGWDPVDVIGVIGENSLNFLLSQMGDDDDDDAAAG